MSHPQSYEILLVPEHKESATGAPEPGTALRSAVVAATGDTGASGYPRYTGEGVEADIDPATHTVEALLVDGAELDYGLIARVADRVGGTQEENGAPEVEAGGEPAPPRPGESGPGTAAREG
ncbi:hypothetical protein OG909_30830 [Streptomyces sp. NBC_01754]|uniref:hypothetical protein n=1 Tax=Streptomyces sp. NBC_01754 TaxID=2975930 RepID=UPI002DDA93AD|nr:hypothetical protein [Streptomyces sp. NBC_01754]WSC96346.1 hypothetical protein OG909_30830 [Streptomyces sp. NBC_01754]